MRSLARSGVLRLRDPYKDSSCKGHFCLSSLHSGAHSCNAVDWPSLLSKEEEITLTSDWWDPPTPKGSLFLLFSQAVSERPKECPALKSSLCVRVCKHCVHVCLCRVCVCCCRFLFVDLFIYTSRVPVFVYVCPRVSVCVCMGLYWLCVFGYMFICVWMVCICVCVYLLAFIFTCC